MKNIQGSCKARPDCQMLEGVWDFKEWMKPFIGKVENHSKYHVFRFTKRQSKVCCVDTCSTLYAFNTMQVEMHYKHYSSDPWLPKGTGNYLIMVRFSLPLFGTKDLCLYVMDFHILII